MNFKNKFFIFFIILISFFFSVNGQTPIPYGLSLDSISMQEFRTFNKIQSFHCYKPSTYNQFSSTILFAIHGSGGDGMSAINDLIDIAERRSAIIIAPNYPQSGFKTLMRHHDALFALFDTLVPCVNYGSSTVIFNKIYRHVLERENRI